MPVRSVKPMTPPSSRWPAIALVLCLLLVPSGCNRQLDLPTELAEARRLVADERYREALTIATKSYGYAKTNFPVADERRGNSALLVGQILLALDEPAKALERLQEAMACFDLVAKDSSAAAETHFALGQAWQAQKDFPRAETHFRQAISLFEKHRAPHNDRMIAAWMALGRLLSQRGKAGEAERLLRQALERTQQSFGRDSPEVANSLLALARHYRQVGNEGQALPILEQALTLREKSLHRGNSRATMLYLETMDAVIALRRERGDLEQVVSLLERKVEQLGATSLLACGALEDLGALHRQAGRLEQAEAVYCWSLANLERAFGDNCPQSRTSLEALVSLYETIQNEPRRRLMQEKLTAARRATAATERTTQ